MNQLPIHIKPFQGHFLFGEMISIGNIKHLIRDFAWPDCPVRSFIEDVKEVCKDLDKPQYMYCKHNNKLVGFVYCIKCNKSLYWWFSDSNKFTFKKYVYSFSSLPGSPLSDFKIPLIKTKKYIINDYVSEGIFCCKCCS